MDTDTLAALAGSTEAPDEPPADETLTPEQIIAAGGIPEGYTRDQKTGEVRLKKRRGRQRQGTPPPGITGPVERGQDEPPDGKARGRVRKGVPRYQKGV